MTDNFSRNLLISGIGHLCLFLLVFFRAVTLPNDPLNIRNAIRVDVVDLPKKLETLPDIRPATPEPVRTPPRKPKELPPAKTTVAPTKPPLATMPPPKSQTVNHEKATKRAMEKFKASEALEKIKQEVAKEQAAKPQVVAGNKVSEGNSLTGLEKIEYDRYFSELESRIRSHWSIPQWLADADLKAQVLVLIDERGFLIKKIFRRASGNDIFDAKVIEAIDSAAPLPPPPQRLRGLLSTSGIVFNFPQ